MSLGKQATNAMLAKFTHKLSDAVAAHIELAPRLDEGRCEGTLTWGQQYLSRHFQRKPSRMHVWLGEQLEGMQLNRGTKVNVVGPRGSAKSTVVTLCYVLQAAVHGWEPYIWIISDTKNQARTHLDNVRAELEGNERLAADFPHACGKGPRWRSTSLELNNGTVIECFGTGQRLRGRRRRENRPTLIVCDDLQNDQHMTSAAQRENTRQWFYGTLLKAGTKSTNIVNLATALHRDALAMQLHVTPGWKSELFRAIEKWPANRKLWEEWEELYCQVDRSDPQDLAAGFYAKHREEMDAGAVLLWPDEEELYSLMKMRVEAGHTSFEREKQSSPIDPERCEWPEQYFAEHIWFEDWPNELMLKTMALDPSKGNDSRFGDYSAFVVLGVDPRGVLYVQADLARRPTPQMVADGVSLYQQHGVESFGIETNQYQELLAGEILAEFQRHGVMGVTPYAIHNHINKQTRIRRLGPYLSQQRVRFKSGCPSTLLLVNQLRDFPLGSHDDGPDALEMALRLAEQHFTNRDTDDGLGSCLVRSA